MNDSSLLVREAAERLGISPIAVRQQIAAGRLPAVKRGRDWWVDARAVERMHRQPAGSGRPLSAPLAWAVLLLASGADEAADRVAGRAQYRSRARSWLREHGLREHAPRLRTRAAVETFYAHPSELRRIVGRPDVLATGASAGDLVGLIGGAPAAEVYASARQREAIVAEHALAAGAGQVQIRWVLDELWPLLPDGGHGRAPRAAILLDLLESDEPRARREAARALAS